jgi:hypothetical protein
LLKYKRVVYCHSCYWADPEKHTHVAMEKLRRVDVVFSRDETKAFDKFRRQAQRHSQSVRDRIKEVVQESGE